MVHYNHIYLKIVEPDITKTNLFHPSKSEFNYAECLTWKDF